eukprot:g13967.t1
MYHSAQHLETITVVKGKGGGNIYTSSNASTAGGVSSTTSSVGPVVLPLSNFETGIVPIPSKLPLLKSLHISDVSLRDKDQDVEELIWLLTDCTESVEVVRIGGCSEATFLSDTAVTRALQIGDKNFVLGQRRDGGRSPGGRNAKKREQNFAAPGVAAREDVEAEKILLLARLRKWFAKNFERLRDTFSAQELGRSESVQQLLKGATSTNSLHMMVSDLDQSCSEAGYISRSGSEEDLQHVGVTSASDGELLDSVFDFEEAAGDDMQMQLVGDHEHDEQASSDEDEDNFFEDVGSEDSDGDLDQLDPDFVRATVSRYSTSGQQATAMNESNSKHAFFPSSNSASTYYRYNAHTGNLPTTEEERAEIEKYMNPCIPPCLLRALNCCTKLRSLTLTRVDYSSLENVGRLQLPSLVWLVMQFSLDRNYRWNFSELFWTPKLQVLHVENRSKTSADLISDFPQLAGVLDLLQLLEAQGNLQAFRVLKSRRMNLDREEIGPVLTLLGKGVAAAAFGEGKREQVEESSTSSTGRVNLKMKAEDAGPARPDNYSEESKATSRRPRVFHSATGLQALSFTCHPQLPLSVQSMLYHRMALGLPAFGVHRNGIVAAQQWPATWPSLNYFWPEMAKITAFNVFASDITFSEFDTEPETEWNQLEEEEKAFFEELAEYFREKRRAYG